MTRTIVIGGGIAGLAVAEALGRRGGREVTLLETESVCATHSSARNAQIWLPLDDAPTTGPLALRSAERLTELHGREDRWLRRDGAVVLAPSAAGSPGPGDEGAARAGLTARPLHAGRLRARTGFLEEATLRRAGLEAWAVDGAGTFDAHAMTQALARGARAHGVRVRTEAPARAIEVRRGAVSGVALDDGQRVRADEVVIAAGAWSEALGESAGAAVELTALRRHLLLLDADPGPNAVTTWCYGEPEVYWRPEPGGLLASPCDEEPSRPCLPTRDPRAESLLAEALGTMAPSLLEARVRTAWACLRVFAGDRELVLGPDSRVEGLHWSTALGGRGMTVAVGAGELCARAMDGDLDPLLRWTRPGRPGWRLPRRETAPADAGGADPASADSPTELR